MNGHEFDFLLVLPRVVLPSCSKIDLPVSYFQDYLTIGFGQPRIDSQQDWILRYAREENGVTTLGFHRQRTTNDTQNDLIIQVNPFLTTFNMAFFVYTVAVIS